MKYFSDNCGGFVADTTEIKQNFSTPGYPVEYPGLLDCEWTLNAPDGRQVEFVIQAGRTESCCDKLTVSDSFEKYLIQFYLPNSLTMYTFLFYLLGL